MEASPELSRLVKHEYGDDALELQRAAEAVEALLTMPGWQILVDLLSGEFSQIDLMLERPKTLTDHVELARLIGRKSGLRAMQDLLSAIRERRDAVVAEQQAQADREAAATATG